MLWFQLHNFSFNIEKGEETELKSIKENYLYHFHHSIFAHHRVGMRFLKYLEKTKTIDDKFLCPSSHYQEVAEQD